MLNYMTKAYRTVSGPASLVLAGVIPMDFEVEKRCVSYQIRRDGEAVFNATLVRARGSKSKLDRLVLEGWQERGSRAR